MRRILSLIPLFFAFSLVAQPLRPTEQREPARGWLMPYATAADADAAPAKHRYGASVEEWTANGNRFEAYFTTPFAWANRQVVVRVAEASQSYELWINGRRAGRNNNPHTPASFVVTKLAKEGRNRIELRLDEQNEMAPIESWRTASEDPSIGAVNVFSSPTLGVRDLFVQSRFADEEHTVVTAEIGVVMKSYALNDRSVRLYYDLKDPAGGDVVTGFGDLTLRMRGEDTIRFVVRVVDTLLWSSERPQHYTLRLRTQREGRNDEFHALPIAMRVVELVDGVLQINGEPKALPITECPADVTAEQLAEMRQKGEQLLRLPASATARTEHIASICDTLGLYLIAPAAIDSSSAGEARHKGGNPSNNPAWQSTYLERVADSYHSFKRHPSVVGFSIADRSANGICLYDSYLMLKNKEPYRPVFYFENGGEWNHDKIGR